MVRKSFWTKIFFALFFTLFLTSTSLAADTTKCIVEKILDGDTFICSGMKIRMIGIDAPESTINPRIEKQRHLGDINTILALGKKAKNFLEILIPPGTEVTLEFDVQKYDKYGRTLAYVWKGNMLVNEVMISEGYAMLYTVPPNVKYEHRFRKAFRQAVERQKGLWKR